MDSPSGRHSLSVRTPPFQGGETGSTPVGATKHEPRRKAGLVLHFGDEHGVSNLGQRLCNRVDALPGCQFRGHASVEITAARLYRAQRTVFGIEIRRRCRRNAGSEKVQGKTLPEEEHRLEEITALASARLGRVRADDRVAQCGRQSPCVHFHDDAVLLPAA